MADKKKYHPGGSVPVGRKKTVTKRPNVGPRPLRRKVLPKLPNELDARRKLPKLPNELDARRKPPKLPNELDASRKVRYRRPIRNSNDGLTPVRRAKPPTRSTGGRTDTVRRASPMRRRASPMRPRARPMRRR